MKHLLGWLAGGMLTLSVAWYAERLDRQSSVADLRGVISTKSSAIRARIEGEINQNLLLVQGMAALIARNPELDQREYEEFAEELLRYGPNLVNVAAARDMVITHMHPLEPNRKAMGLDYTKVLDQTDAAFRAKETGKMILAGPVDLVQGGRAIIGRMPVFVGSESDFWGIVSAPMKYEKFLHTVGLPAFETLYDVAIRGLDAAGEQGEVFLGDPALFTRAPVTTEVLVPGGEWVIAVTPKGGWASVPARNWNIWAVSIGTFGLFSLVLFINYLRSRERETSRERLESSSRRYESLFEHASDAIVLYTIDTGLLVDANKPAMKLFGFSQDDIGRIKVTELYPKTLKGEAVRKLEDMREGGNPVFNWDIINRDGIVLPAEISAKLIETGDEPVIQAIVRDRSRQRQYETDLLAAKREAEFANHAKSQFLANMSHELRTPLNAIIGFAQIIGSELFGKIGVPQYRDYALDIQKSGEHLLRVISDILDISKIEAGEMRFDLEPVDIRVPLTEATRICNGRAMQKALDLHLDLPDTILHVRGDELKLKQAFLNIIGNAIKFTEVGHLTISAIRLPEGDVEISIADTGRGMSAEDIEWVMHPFAQANDIMTSDNEGTGLGLALVDAFVKAHGGTVRIESDVGKGTTVFVRLPG